MTPEADPDALHGHIEETPEAFSTSNEEIGRTEPLSPFEADFATENEQGLVPMHRSDGSNGELIAFGSGLPVQSPFFDAPVLPRLIPHLGHVLLFFVVTILVMGAGQALGILLLEHSHLFGHRSFQDLFQLSADDARLSLPVQAFSYALVAVVVIPIFTVLWHEPFGLGVHWNARISQRRFVLLAMIGVAAGFGIGAFGNFLPMPKDPPIMQDMMKSPIGAWMMLIFGITGAPLLEELAFRGFLLPGLINTFRWLARKSVISDVALRAIGIPFSVLLTSAGFAFMHSPQVSHAWGPLLLIGMVSVVLCVVRLTMDSVAAGVVVHAAYNLTLFAGVLAETGGFRHLEKLTT